MPREPSQRPAGGLVWLEAVSSLQPCVTEPKTQGCDRPWCRKQRGPDLPRAPSQRRGPRTRWGGTCSLMKAIGLLWILGKKAGLWGKAVSPQVKWLHELTRFLNSKLIKGQTLHSTDFRDLRKPKHKTRPELSDGKATGARRDPAQWQTGKQKRSRPLPAITNHTYDYL